MAYLGRSSKTAVYNSILETALSCHNREILRTSSSKSQNRLTQHAPKLRQRAPEPWWWDCCPKGQRACFQAVGVARGWFRQRGVVSSHTPVPLKGHNASR